MIMDINPQWITLILACNAMVASMAGAFVNTRIAKTQFNANVLSVNRQKWIETTRDLVASLNSQLLAAAALRCIVEEPTGRVIAQPGELLRRMESLLRTMSTIELMLNPLEENHQKLNSLMKDAVDQLRSPSPGGGIEDRVEIICRDITQVSQGILKREWARVKRGE
jgi:hypothetical protein